MYKKLKKLKDLFLRVVFMQLVNKEDFCTTKRSCENLIEDYTKNYGIKFSILRYGSICRGVEQ